MMSITCQKPHSLKERILKGPRRPVRAMKLRADLSPGRTSALSDGRHRVAATALAALGPRRPDQGDGRQELLVARHR